MKLQKAYNTTVIIALPLTTIALLFLLCLLLSNNLCSRMLPEIYLENYCLELTIAMIIIIITNRQ